MIYHNSPNISTSPLNWMSYWIELNWIIFLIEISWKILNLIIFCIDFFGKILNWIIVWIEFLWKVLNWIICGQNSNIESIWVSDTPKYHLGNQSFGSDNSIFRLFVQKKLWKNVFFRKMYGFIVKVYSTNVKYQIYLPSSPIIWYSSNWNGAPIGYKADKSSISCWIDHRLLLVHARTSGTTIWCRQIMAKILKSTSSCSGAPETRSCF